MGIELASVEYLVGAIETQLQTAENVFVDFVA
jgi:hypothetical protein